MGNNKYVANSFIWGTIARFVDAGIKFFTLPLLLSFYGKEEYGLLSLAISINAYLQLLDLGVNTGAIKFFSQWLGEHKYNTLDRVVRTSITFYTIVGLLNAIVLIILVYWGIDWFNLTANQELVMRNLMLLLAGFAIVNWSGSVFNQLLTAGEKFAYIQKILILRSLLTILLVWVTIHFNLNLQSYFVLFLILNTIQIIPFVYKTFKCKYITSFMPLMDWSSFKPVLKYSLAILAIGIFSMTATKMRPIVLGAFSIEGIGVVTEYRIMETITMFVISLGGMFIKIFLPKTTKLLVDNDQERISNFAVKGTIITTIICVVLCLPFVLNGKEVLMLYVGEEYSGLNIWLSVWLITILSYLHNSPISSLVLSSGRTKNLVYITAFSATISLIVNAALCSILGVGSAVLGYVVYILIQMSFYYLYFNKVVLKVDSLKVFMSFIVPVSLGFLSIGIVAYLNIIFANLMLQVVVKTLLWISLFVLMLYVYYVLVNPNGFKYINVKVGKVALKMVDINF